MTSCLLQGRHSLDMHCPEFHTRSDIHSRQAMTDRLSTQSMPGHTGALQVPPCLVLSQESTVPALRAPVLAAVTM